MAKNGHRIRALRANSLRIRTGNFLPPCRELNRVIREMFALIRETRSRPLFWHFALPANPIVPTDLEHCREGEQGRPRPDARRRRSRFRAPRPGVNVRPKHDANRSSSSLTRTTGVPDFAMAASVASRASSRTELHHSPGTEGSNPLWTSS